ncbi:DUF309 domain-containing protein [Bacillus sp. T33-2]|uniref:DUF309 domain-containing protein n=1 Tax=Bacillus sp. T33-2 TaxID=2054168 RepID=UPI000C771EA2|nr:DUF309 domain-containing protein [Bacillus sp. T33-2]PLR92638.1 DUF309 domain-containing protein [Bacillus sp. T33-2]
MQDFPIEYYEFYIKFNEGDYYTCHDLLEEMWMTDKSNYFLKGLLQMTVSLYHYGYGNVKGARSMMRAAHEYLQDYRPKHWGLDVEKVYPFIEQCLLIIPEDVDRVPFGSVQTLPPLPELFLYLEDD